MIVVRDVFQAKYGRGDELVALFREAWEMLPGFARSGRILTDASGQFFQVVTEIQVESLGEWERIMREEMANADFGPWFTRMTELVESGRRDFYTIVHSA